MVFTPKASIQGGESDWEAALAEAERQNTFLTLDEGFEDEPDGFSELEDEVYAELALGWADEDRRM